MLIIFPIIISLCLVGLAILVLKKIPQLADFSAPLKTQPKKIPEPSRQSLAPIIDKQKKIRFKLNVDQVFHKIKSVGFWRGKTKLSVNRALSEGQKEATNIFLSFKKQFSGLKGKLNLTKKDEFDRLDQVFCPTPEEKKIIQDQSSSAAPAKNLVKAPQPSATPFFPAKAKTLDFNGFMANGKKEPSYEIKKTSFDRALGETAPKSAAKLKKDRSAFLKRTQAQKDKEFLKLQKLHSQEQALIKKIAQDPKDLKLYQKLSDLYCKIENFKDAQASLEYVLRIEPDNKKAVKSLAKIKKMLHNK